MVAIDEDLLNWVKERSEPGGTFYSISHAVERGLALLREEVERIEAIDVKRRETERHGERF